MSPFTFKLLCLSSLKGIGQQTLSRLLNKDILNLQLEEILKVANVKNIYSAINLDNAKSFAEYQVEEAAKRGHFIISPMDDVYPDILRSLDVSPAILFIAGSIEAVNSKCIAVIGTREPTVHGIEIAKRITTWFCQQGLSILSGLAIGVDTVAHESTLAIKGRTIAVLAHGLDSIYPAKNKHLADEIIKAGGALVSEYPYGVTVRGAQLVQRDKVQAALSAAVILIQSDLKGGSLHASREAIKVGRHLIVAGQSMTDLKNSEPKAQANQLLLNGGTEDIRKLMKCTADDISRIIYLKSKSDYEFVYDLVFTLSDSNFQKLKTRNLFE